MASKFTFADAKKQIKQLEEELKQKTEELHSEGEAGRFMWPILTNKYTKQTVLKNNII